MSSTSREGGRVVRLQVSPWRDVTHAERVKTRPRFGVGSGVWRLTLSCGHLVMPLKLVANIQEAVPPERAACWKCLVYGAPGSGP